MKEEGKYYTPSYDEFHIGFNYEYYNEYSKPNGTWEKVELIEFCDWFVHNFDLEKSRVKYLDRQDIIDLGWKYNGLFFEYADCSLSEDGNRVTIYDVSDNVIFNGKIKNKSELKKIMRMLEII